MPSQSRVVSGLKTRSHQRFRTGILLGLILAIVLGMATPLLAQDAANSSPIAPENLAQANPAPIAPPPIRPPAPPQPRDIETHWAKDCIQSLAEREIVTLGDLGLFYPDVPATWADLSASLNQTFPTTEPPYQGASAVQNI
ncbi:MAG: S-layer homology domain-containing protein [Cyanobacteria bacterium]|nr:S-layer homology domain-containing protein [Cyanobacteriota bacterium]